MQGGTNHINEQPISYWANLFLERGFVPISCIRPKYKLAMTDAELGGIDVVYANNIVLYVNNEKLPSFDINPEEYVDDFELDQLIYTWKNGEIISENLLKEPEITAEDLFGAWTYNEGTLVFEDKRVKRITNADGSEYISLYFVSEKYLYLFSEEGKSEEKIQFAIDGDWLTLMGEEGEKITFQREE